MRAVVVGGGIAGLATAWSLVKRGHAVTLLEQGGLPNPLAASGDHHRIIRRAYGGADGYALMIDEAFAAWDAMWRDLGRSHYVPRGLLMLSQTPGDGGESFREGFDRTGVAYDLYDPDDAARRHPFLDPATFRYAFHTPEGGALLCRRIAADLAAFLRARGAAVRTNTRVVAVDAGAATVTTEGGEKVAGDVLIVAAGAWALKLFPELGDALAVQRTVVAYLEPPADLRRAWDEAPVVLDVGGAIDGWIIPPMAGLGLKLGAGVHRTPAPDADARRVPEAGEGERLRGLFAPPLTRIEEYAVTDVSTCAYTFTADERFYARAFGRTLVVSACSGHGYKFGALVGRRVAAWAEDGDAADLVRWLRAEKDAAAA